MEALEISTIHMWLSFAVIFGAIVLYASDRFSLEMVSAGVVIVFLLLFQLFPVTDAVGRSIIDAGDILAGFANPALFSIISLLMIGQAMYQSGALEGPTSVLLSATGDRPKLTLAVIFLVVIVISAFLNNTPVAVMFIPIIGAVAAKMDTPVSKVMIPLSFMCVLGGMTTLIGSSTNLLVAQSAEASSVPIGFFDFTLPGLLLASVGAAYVFLVLPHTLPNRSSMSGELVGTSGKQYIAQIDLTPDHPLIGTKAVAGLFPDLQDMTIRMIQRGEDALLPPFEDIELQRGDAVIVAATRKVLTDLVASKPHFLSGMIDARDENRKGAQSLNLIEAVVAPGSRMIGRSIQQIGFRYQTGCIVLGIQRRSRMIRVQMNNIRLEAGDVLLIFGTHVNIQGLRASRDILPLEWSAEEVPDIANALKARVIFAVTVASVAFGFLPIVIAAMIGASAMILAGCLNIRQAARSIDRRIYMLIGAALAMGTALEKTGGATFLAHSLVALFADAGPAILLSAFFLLIAFMTNVLSNNATAVLFTPIAVKLANEIGVPPESFVFAVIFAANCSFATPMAYQTNLLVMGPGHYQFMDFVKAGVPLIILIWLTFSFFAPWYYSF